MVHSVLRESSNDLIGPSNAVTDSHLPVRNPFHDVQHYPTAPTTRSRRHLQEITHMTPTNLPGQYDEARVARLKPIRAAVEQPGLPASRKRKLFGILNALQMQIEDGGDSPAVNRHLLAALREGVIHQVGAEKARPVLARIDAFEQAESRWP